LAVLNRTQVPRGFLPRNHFPAELLAV